MIRPATHQIQKVMHLTDIQQGASEQQLDTSYARLFQPLTSYTAGQVVTANGVSISRIANGTSRASYDATEAALWTPVVATPSAIPTAVNAALASNNKIAKDETIPVTAYDWAEVTRDTNGRVGRGLTTDGRNVLPYVEAQSITADTQKLAGITTRSAALYGDPLKTTRDTNNRMGEDTLGPDGCTPDWVLDRWATRMGRRSASSLMSNPRVEVPKFFFDATSKANGAIPANADTGQVMALFGGAPLKLAGGYIVHDEINPTNNAGYLQVELLGDVTEIGVLANWPQALGSIDVVLPASDWEDDVGTVQAGVHYVALGNGAWHVSNWTGTAESPMYRNSVAGAVTGLGDIPTVIRIDKPNATITILLPDGTQQTVTNALISTNTSRFAVFELYEQDTVTADPAKIKAIWAASDSIQAMKSIGTPTARAIKTALRARGWAK